MPKQNGLTGQTRMLAIFGWPLTYTLSPQIQNQALKKAGFDARYMALPCPNGASFLRIARGLQASPHFLGGNITNPFKREALKLGRPTVQAKAIGAGNTLVRGKKGWEVHNTDAPGFLAALKESGVRIQGNPAWVLGAGGAARAVIFALKEAGASSVTVLARRPLQARASAALAGSKGKAGALEAQVLQILPKSSLVINTLPGAQLGKSWGSRLPEQTKGVAVDISYQPLQTPFLTEAKKRGWRTVNGLGMLRHQARIAFQTWRPALKSLSLLSA